MIFLDSLLLLLLNTFIVYLRLELYILHAIKITR